MRFTPATACRSEKDPRGARQQLHAWRAADEWWACRRACIRPPIMRREPRPASPSQWVPHIIGDIHIMSREWGRCSPLVYAWCIMHGRAPFHLINACKSEQTWQHARDRLQDLHTAMDMHDDDAIIRRFCKQKQFAWRRYAAFLAMHTHQSINGDDLICSFSS